MPAPRSLPDYSNLNNPGPDYVPGLSSAHNLSADEPGVLLHSYEGGSVTSVKFPRGGREQVGGGLKKSITEFSRKSRREMLNYLNSLNKNKVKALPLFITLTYPDEFPRDKASWTEHFNRRFRRRFERKYGQVGMIWRKEFKQRETGRNRGAWAPHFHLLVFTHISPWQMYEFVSRAWYESCGEISPEHLEAGTRVEKIRSWRGVMGYAAKYMAKVERLAFGVESPGRFWGKWNADALPVDPVEQLLPFDQAIRVRRALRKYSRMRLRNHRRGLQNMTVYVPFDASRRLIQFYTRGGEYQ